MPNVAATYNIGVGDTWTYDYSGSDGEGNMVIIVTSVTQPDGPVIGDLSLNSEPLYDEVTLDYSFICSDDFISYLINVEGLTPETRTYAGEERSCIDATPVMGILFIIDIETGIALEINDGVGEEFVLIDWSISGGASDAEWLVDVGEEWTYEGFEGTTSKGTIGYQVTNVPEYPSPPLADMYEDGSFVSSGNPLAYPYLEPDFVYDNNTIADLALIETSVGDFGERSCMYVILNDGSDTELWIDIAKRVLLYYTYNYGYDYIVLIDWAIIILGPEIIIMSPTNSEVFNNTSPNFNITINESDLSSSWYTLNGGDPNYLTAPINGLNTGTIDQDAWDDLDDGPVVITFYVEDAAGNRGQDVVTVIKYTDSEDSGPPTIPGYDIFIIIGAIGIVSCIMLVIELKKRTKI